MYKHMNKQLFRQTAKLKNYKKFIEKRNIILYTMFCEGH